MIRVENLRKRFGNVVAVDGISFRVEDNETTALLGPNGSGKSTTLKSIVGLVVPDEGTVKINGVDVHKNPKEAKKFLSYLPQRVNFYDNLKVVEILEFFRKIRNLPAERMEYVVEKLELKEYLNKFPRELSGGVLQKLGIAISLMPDTPILVLDEPTLSLDPEGIMKFKSLLSSLKSEGKTILFTTHLLNEVDELADRVGILVAGKLVTFEKSIVLKEKIKFESKVYLVIKNMMDKFVDIAYEEGALEVRRNGTSMVIRATSGKILDIIFSLKNSGAKIENFQTASQSFETIYRELLKTKESER